MIVASILAAITSIRHVSVLLPEQKYREEHVVAVGDLGAVTLQPAPIDPTPRGPIPHILWFTYSHNILEKQRPEAYYNNIMKTIDAYRSEWNDETTVKFLIDENCSELLLQVDKQENTTLAEAFSKEYRGDLRADLCRVAALYLHGGYYFDVDLEVVKPLQLDPSVSFSTARDHLFGYFFQAFLAATPGHPVLRENLHTFMEFYFDQKGICFEKARGVMGPCTLMKAWNQTNHRGHARLLKETHLRWHKLYPNMTERGIGDACHWVLHDPKEMEVYFYSRIMGSTKCGFQ